MEDQLSECETEIKDAKAVVRNMSIFSTVSASIVFVSLKVVNSKALKLGGTIVGGAGFLGAIAGIIVISKEKNMLKKKHKSIQNQLNTLSFNFNPIIDTLNKTYMVGLKINF